MNVFNLLLLVEEKPKKKHFVVIKIIFRYKARYNQKKMIQCI